MTPAEMIKELNQSRITITNLKNNLTISRQNVERLVEENNKYKKLIDEINEKYENILKEKEDLISEKTELMKMNQKSTKPFKIIYI